MTFVLPSAQYLMTTNSSTNRGNENGASSGLKTAGNLPITTNGAQFINSQSSSLTGTPERLYFGLDSQNSTSGYDMSSDPRVVLTSLQYNAPNRIQTSTMANEGASITVVSGSTESNFKRYLIGGNDTPFCSSQAGPNTICIDPTSGSEDSTGGTFDDTDVSGWGFGCVRFNLQGSSTLQCFFQRVFMFQTTKDAANIPKFTGLSSSWDDAFTAVQGTNYTNKIGAWLTKAGTSFFVPCPFQFGDGLTPTTFNDGGANVTSPSDNAAGQENFRLSNKSMRVYLSQRDNDLDSTILSGNYTWGTPAPWDFSQSNNGACSLLGNFNGMGDFTLGSSVKASGVFTLASGSNVISNGADIDTVTVNGDLDIQGSSVTTFNDITVTGAMNFDTAGTYNIDGSAISEVTNSSGGAIILNLSSGATINTNTGPSITINNSVTVNINVTDTSGTPIQNSRVRIVSTQTVGTITTGDVILEGLTDASGNINTTTFNYEGAFNPGGLGIQIKARQGSVDPFKKPFLGTGTISPSGFSLTVALLDDE